MDVNKIIDKLSRKLSQRSLIFIIVFLSLAIIGIIGAYLAKKENPTPSGSLSTSLETVQEKPPLVVIDPGHGGWDPGAMAGDINEKDIVLDISIEIERLLIEKNIDYYMIRTEDIYVSLEDRAQIANEKKGRLFISIHNNSFTDSAQSGILTAYNPYSPNGKDMAKIMQSKIKELGMKNRDIMARPNLYVLRHTEMPALLLEIGFMSNKKDLKLLTAGDFQKKCAKQVVSGVEDILDKYILDSKATDAEGSPEAD